VYPTLQLLEETGLVTASQQDDKRVFTLTATGQKALDERLVEGPLPWMNPESAEGHGAFRHAIGQLVMAAKQVAHSNNPQLVEQATVILNDARRKLYQLLAEA
jgi:DNA-binding PadR family transcriptional regulator